MTITGCNQKMCPMQVGAVDNCNLTKEQCPYFTKDDKYEEFFEKAKQEVAREIFDELDTNLNNLIKYYKEKRRYVTEVEYNEFEQRFCDIKIRTFEDRLLKNTELKKKYIGESK